MKKMLLACKVHSLLALPLLLTLLNSIVAEAQSEYTTEQNKMVLTREDATLNWSIRLKAKEVDQSSVWIDWNNNALYEEGEAYDFSQYNNSSPVTSTTITIYGKVTTLSASFNYLTKLDVTANDALEDLQVGNNKLTALDLSHNDKLYNLICQNNRIEQLDCSANKKLRRLSCYTNHIQGENMWRLVRSLVDRTGQERAGKIHIINSVIGAEMENIATKKQVATLVDKNWTVFDWKDGEEEGENPYTGTPDPDDDNYVAKDPKVILTSSETTGKWLISLNVEEEHRNTCWIDLNNDGGYQKGEELKHFETLMEIPRTSNTLALYGKYSAVKCAENKITAIDFGSDASALKTLIVENNALTALDLGVAPNLEYLNCDRNLLTSLDLANHTHLRELTCYLNKLEQLSLTGCSALVKVTCTDNQLKALPLDGVELLSELYCSGNKIETLQLGHCTALRSLYCSNNKLSALGLKENENLEILYCAGNSFSELDLKGFPLLSVVNCAQNKINALDPSKNPKLTKLYAYENKLETLDLSSLGLLAFVDVSDNGLKRLTLQKNVSLNDLHCSKNHLEALDLLQTPALLRLVCNDNAIRALDFSVTSHLEGFRGENNKLSQLDFSACPSLAKVFVQGNEIQGQAMTSFITSLPLREKEKSGLLVVVDLKAEQEKNICTNKDVPLAIQKYWVVKDYNGGNAVDYAGKPVGVEEIATRGATIYPNPARHTFLVSGLEAGERVQLFSLAGVLLAETCADEMGACRVDVATLPVGTYVVRCANSCYKLVIE